jgi:hypothetical protein
MIIFEYRPEADFNTNVLLIGGLASSRAARISRLPFQTPFFIRFLGNYEKN